MAITNAAENLAINSVITSTLDSISVISLRNNSGEFFRKMPTKIEIITSQKKHFRFWLNENEGNGEIIAISLYGNGATTVLGTGTEIATQPFSISKDNTQSLTIEWTMEVI